MRKAEAGDVTLSPWQLCVAQQAIGQLEDEHFAEGEHSMAQAERPDLYEPAGFVADKPIERRHLVDQLAAVLAAV